MPAGGTDKFLHRTAERLRHDFGIHHTTIQVEREDVDGVCHVVNGERGACWPGANNHLTKSDPNSGANSANLFLSEP